MGHPPAPSSRPHSLDLRDDVRVALQHLDQCLGLLEDAQERNLDAVPPEILVKLRSCVPVVTPGMSIAKAMDCILRHQEPLLTRRRAQRGAAREATRPAISAPALASGVGRTDRAEHDRTERDVSVQPIRATDPIASSAPLDRSEAHDLTERIRASADHLCRLLLEAHSRRAWSALGYGTWEDYVGVEFHLSRSRSYQLLDQARVIRTIEEAIGVSRILDISPFAAEQLKPHLADVVESVRSRTAGVPAEKVAHVAARIVHEERRRIAAGRPPRPSVTLPRTDDGRHPRAGADRLADAIVALANMPPVPVVLARCGTAMPARSDVSAALRWLTALAVEWAEDGHGA